MIHRITTGLDALADRYGSSMGIAVVVLVAWEVYTRYFNPRGQQYFPSMEFVAQQTIANSDRLISGLRTTALEVVGAYVLAMVLGVLLAVLFSEFYSLRQMMMAPVVFAYALPAAILAPLFVIWFGSGMEAVAIFGAWLAFFPVFINTMTGMNQVEDEFYHLGEIYGASDWQMLRYIKVWKALPHISASAKIAVQYSIVGVVVAEFLASGTGLGFLIVISTQRAQLGFVFGIVILLVIFAIVFFKVVSLIIERVTPAVS